MVSRNNILKAFTPARQGSKQTNQAGTTGYDNIRENIDPHIKTRVLSSQEIKTNEFILTDSNWEDQQVLLGSVGFGASAPIRTAYKGGEVLAFNKAQDNQIYFTAQLTHKHKLNTLIEFHIHDTPADDTAGVVRWILTYSWADINVDFAAESTITSEQTIDVNTASKHIYFDMEELTGTASGVSSLLICSLTREGSHLNDTYDNDIYVVALDFHIQVDTLGSKSELAK